MARRETVPAWDFAMDADRPRQQAAREATSWLIALQEDPDDPNLRRQFEAWRSASSLNDTVWQSTQRVLEIGRSIPPRPSDEWPAYLSSRERSVSARTPRRRRWIVATLGMAAAAAIALTVGPSVLLRLEADHLTSTAELRDIRLDDGSAVMLSARSAIAVSGTTGERQVTLVEGEAFFQVRPDAARPFRVISGPVRTTVVGTRFDVRRDSWGVFVGVEEGQVEVEASRFGTRERLQAGEAIRIEFDGKVARSADQLTVAAWRKGQLVAQNMSLQEAVDQLRRFYSGAIIMTDRSLGSRRVTGIYNLADPEEALRAIGHAHGAKVRRVTPWMLLISAE